MHGRYLRSQDAIDREVMWHFTVDDHEIHQHLPISEVGWHAGDGYGGPGNRRSIAIEICVNSDGDFEKAKANAAELVAYLIKTAPCLLPFPGCVVQHNGWSGKDCPHQIRATPGAWEGFLAMVRANLAPPAWDPVAEIGRLRDRGIINGEHAPEDQLTWGQFATVLNRFLDRK
jgi:N-acetylmuramoyl-L-alanine amidase